MAWRPKKQASAQAVLLRVIRSSGACGRAGAVPAPWDGSWAVARARTSGIQGRIAAAASTAQMPRPAFQLPPIASVRGTVTAAASEVPRARAME